MRPLYVQAAQRSAQREIFADLNPGTGPETYDVCDNDMNPDGAETAFGVPLRRKNGAHVRSDRLIGRSVSLDTGH